jgi:hypothetical protein
VILFAAPQLAIGLLQHLFGLDGSGTGGFGGLAALQISSIALTIVSFYLTAVGWGASHWTIVRQAVGAPAPFGEALSFGFRNSMRVWGWILLYSLVAGIGFCALVLPGIYLAIAGGLIVPAAIFQRGSSALSISFRLVNRNFGAAAGRLILLYLPMLAVALITAAVTLGEFSAASASPLSGAVPDMSGVLVNAVLGTVAEMILIIGVLLTYGQIRARTLPSTSLDLAAAL